MDIVLIIIALTCLVISLLSLLIFGIDKKEKIVSLSTPPLGLNPLEVAYISKKKVFEAEVLLLIPYLERKGYLKVAKSSSSHKGKSKSFTIQKLRDYDGNNAIEKYLFNNLFESKDEISFEELGSKGNFIIGLRVAMGAINSKQFHDKVFNEKSQKIKQNVKHIDVAGLVIINLIYIIISIFQNNTESFDVSILIALLILFLFQIFGLFVMASGSTNSIEFGDDVKTSKGKNRVKINIFVGGSLFLFTSLMNCIVFFNILSFAVAYMISVFMIAIGYFITSYIDKKTDYGTKIYYEIEGYSSFLEQIISSKEADNYLNDNSPYFYAVGMPKNRVYKYNKYFSELNALATKYYGRGVENKDETLDKVNNNITNSNLIIEIEEQKYNDMLDGSLTILNEVATSITVPKLEKISISNIIKQFVSN